MSYARQSEVVLFLFLGSGLPRFSKSGQSSLKGKDTWQQKFRQLLPVRIFFLDSKTTVNLVK